MSSPACARGFLSKAGISVDTRTFLERVHAKSDQLVVCCHRPDASGKRKEGIFWQRGSYNYAEIDKAVSDITQWDAEPNTTVYYTVGSFADHEYSKEGRTKWYRKAQYATHFKAITFDLDIGEGKQYTTQKDACIALVDVIQKIGLPFPMLVSSGKGIHVYWPLEQEVPKRIWLLLSTALKAALAEYQLEIDTTKINDPSMVLRPVGTHHKKEQPWRDVAVLRDCADQDPMVLAGVLKKWAGLSPAMPSKPKRKSSIADAILSSNDVVLEVVAEHCKQINALVASGGFSDANGDPVEEPLWRASLGIAKHCTDQEAAVIALAGQHPDFDLDANMRKLEGWGDHGPTTCDKFAELCPSGCEGCPYRGNIKSPARLSATTKVVVETESGKEEEYELPDGYIIRDNCVYKEVKEKVESNDANGNPTTTEQVDWVLISRYLMHVTGIFKNYENGATTFRLAVKYPMVGWTEEDHEVAVLSPGSTFNTFLNNRQIFDSKTPAQQEKLRIFIVDYLAKVQSLNPTGVDFTHFGWQRDDSFVCGREVIGADVGADVMRRLKGSATLFDETVKTNGSREGWVEAMKLLDKPEAVMVRRMMFLAMGSVISRAAGNCTGVVSIYSPRTNTGKTLSLFAINSMFGHPKKLLLSKEDTTNALYRIRGVLNQMPCTIDEMTTVDAAAAVKMVYNLSAGVEKNSMDQRRELRQPVRWTGPTFITTNVSFHHQFDQAQTNDSALRARCIEYLHEDQSLVIEEGEDGISEANKFVDKLFDNYGWAYPELVRAVVSAGGDQELWRKVRPVFTKKFGNAFAPDDKYAAPMIVCGWIMSTIAKKLGLISFDVDQTAQDWIDFVRKTHEDHEKNQADAIDIVSQFLAEHNDQIVHSYKKDTDLKESVQMPPPDKAVARELVITDANNDLKRGSYVAINIPMFKKWLARTRDDIERISRELRSMHALIADRQRVTLFKGCAKDNPGQSFCLMVDLTHPRFTEGLEGTEAIKNSTVLQAILGGQQHAP